MDKVYYKNLEQSGAKINCATKTEIVNAAIDGAAINMQTALNIQLGKAVSDAANIIGILNGYKPRCDLLHE